MTSRNYANALRVGAAILMVCAPVVLTASAQSQTDDVPLHPRTAAELRTMLAGTWFQPNDGALESGFINFPKVGSTYHASCTQNACMDIPAKWEVVSATSIKMAGTEGEDTNLYPRRVVRISRSNLELQADGGPIVKYERETPDHFIRIRGLWRRNTGDPTRVIMYEFRPDHTTVAVSTIAKGTKKPPYIRNVEYSNDGFKISNEGFSQFDTRLDGNYLTISLQAQPGFTLFRCADMDCTNYWVGSEIRSDGTPITYSPSAVANPPGVAVVQAKVKPVAGNPATPSSEAGDIRKVDFKNFTFASKCRQDMGDLRIPQNISLKTGYWSTTGHTNNVSFMLDTDNTSYGDVLHNNQVQAVLVGRCGKPDGTVTYSEIFVYAMKDRQATLVATLSAPDKDKWGWGYPVVAVSGGKIIVTYDTGGTSTKHQFEVSDSFSWNGTAFVRSNTNRRPARSAVNCADHRHVLNPACDVSEGAP